MGEPSSSFDLVPWAEDGIKALPSLTSFFLSCLHNASLPGFPTQNDPRFPMAGKRGSYLLFSANCDNFQAVIDHSHSMVPVGLGVRS